VGSGVAEEAGRSESVCPRGRSYVAVLLPQFQGCRHRMPREIIVVYFVIAKNGPLRTCQSRSQDEVGQCRRHVRIAHQIAQIRYRMSSTSNLQETRSFPKSLFESTAQTFSCTLRCLQCFLMLHDSTRLAVLSPVLDVIR
jgi:hypothetical protein